MTHCLNATGRPVLLVFVLVLAVIAPVTASGQTVEDPVSGPSSTPSRVVRGRHLVEWLEELVRTAQENDISLESIGLTLAPEKQGDVELAAIEVFSPERFSRLSHLITHRVGRATMNDLSPDQGPKRRQVLFSLNVDPRSIVEEQLARIESPAAACDRIITRLAESSAVQTTRLVLTRPAPLKLFDRQLARVGIELTMKAGTAELITIANDLAAAYSFYYPRSVKLLLGSPRTLVVTGSLIVKPLPPAQAPSGEAQCLRRVVDTVSVSGIVAAQPVRTSDQVRVDLTGKVRTIGEARKAIVRSLEVEGLKTFDQLGFSGDSTGLAVLGLLFFQAVSK